MNDAIKLLLMEAYDRRSMSIPNQNTITEHTAKENKRLADQYELAAEALKQMHNKLFSDGIVDGVKRIVEVCKMRDEKT